MTMHGPYGDDYGQDDTADLFRSLALASARLWEELFQRLGRLERAQSELHELFSKIEMALPLALGTDGLEPGARGGGPALPPATSGPLFGATATSEPSALSWLTDPANASAPTSGTEGIDDLAFNWHVHEPEDSPSPASAPPQMLNGLGADPSLDSGPPPPPPGFFAGPAPVSDLQFESAQGDAASEPPPPPFGFEVHDAPPAPPSSADFGFGTAAPPPPPPPPPVGFHVDSALGAPPPPPAGFQIAGGLGAPLAPPPPPPPPVGFHVEGVSAPPPPPPDFSALGTSIDPGLHTGFSAHDGFGTGSEPPPPPLGYTIVRPAGPLHAMAPPSGTDPAAFEGQAGGASASGPSGTPGTGEGVNADADEAPPAITPDFFARAGWRRR